MKNTLADIEVLNWVRSMIFFPYLGSLFRHEYVSYYEINILIYEFCCSGKDDNILLSNICEPFSWTLANMQHIGYPVTSNFIFPSTTDIAISS